MTRAERIEAAARVVEAMIRRQEPSRPPPRHNDVELDESMWRTVDALRAALDAPPPADAEASLDLKAGEVEP